MGEPTITNNVPDASAETATAAEVSAVITTAVISPVDTVISTNNRRRHIQGRGRGRGRPRKRVRKLTAAQKAAAQEAREELKTHKLNTKYRRKLQLRLMEVVESMDLEGGERFLKPAVQENGWEYHKCLDIDKIEADVDGFFTLFSTFLASLLHHKYKHADGSKMGALHDTLRRYCTAVNNCWTHNHRPIPHKFASLVADMLSNKRKKETKLKASGDIPDNGGREKIPGL